MKTLKKVVLAFMVAVSMGAFSTSAMAEASDGRIVYAPADAIDLIINKVTVALDGITKGVEGEEAAKLVKAALDSTKELNASDKVGMQVQRANARLRAARAGAKSGNIQTAEQELKEALRMFQEIKRVM